MTTQSIDMILKKVLDVSLPTLAALLVWAGPNSLDPVHVSPSTDSQQKYSNFLHESPADSAIAVNIGALSAAIQQLKSELGQVQKLLKSLHTSDGGGAYTDHVDMMSTVFDELHTLLECEENFGTDKFRECLSHHASALRLCRESLVKDAVTFNDWHSFTSALGEYPVVPRHLIGMAKVLDEDFDMESLELEMAVNQMLEGSDDGVA